ncbi:hypothetical protein BRADI_1g21660v3 [Brachypodium distachyon]|uniref:Uncharacterized protein n=1 Tax=Brachypodium distachyon TaxID=15368 RepID=I1GSF5_BRADI|nr:hypothetical protein BRADI_1g21660v3 [Brachypodium distachyon]
MAESTLELGVEASELVPGLPGRNGQTEWPVCVVGFTTACMAVALAIYKAPSGIFGDHKLAYYVSVFVAGVLGLAEVFAAITWMSGPHQAAQHPHGRARRCVLYGSLVPLAFVAGLGGVHLLFKSITSSVTKYVAYCETEEDFVT